MQVLLRGHDDSSLVAEPVMQMQRTLCPAPTYWDRVDRPAHPRELAKLNCLTYVLGSDALTWAFDGPDGSHRVDVRGSFRANNSMLLIDAMLRGIGVGLLPTIMVEALVRDGRLEPLFPDYRSAPACSTRCTRAGAICTRRYACWSRSCGNGWAVRRHRPADRPGPTPAGA